MKFTIISPKEYDYNVGGICALYSLKKELEQRQQNADIKIVPNWYANSPINNDLDDEIAIIPEIYPYNPLGYKNVVRWILNKPTNIQGYKNSDKIFLCSNEYIFNVKNIEDTLLPVSYDIFDPFYNKDLPRNGTCYLVRKAKDKQLIYHPENAINIDDYAEKGGNDYLITVFNTCRRFICYDHACALAVYSALCGCETIVIPDGIRSVEQALLQHPAYLFGIAWGFYDLNRAQLTQKLLPVRIKELKILSKIYIDIFLDKCQKDFYDGV